MGMERGAPGSHKFVGNPSAEEGSIQAAVTAAVTLQSQMLRADC